MKKRVLSLLLALTLALSLLPMSAAAVSPASVTAYVTMSYEGAVISNGGKQMYAVPVTLGCGKTVEDAVAAAIEAVGFTYERTSGYGSTSTRDFSTYPSSYDGTDSAYFGTYTGCTGGSLMSAIFINGDESSGGNLAVTVSEGDCVDVILYKYEDAVPNYLYFSGIGGYAGTTATVQSAEPAVNTYGKSYSSSSWSYGAASSVAEATVKYYTLADGTFTEKTNTPLADTGTVYVVATRAGYAPAICKVTVFGTTDADYVAAAKAQLAWSAIKATNTAQSNVTSNLILPSTISVSDKSVAVSWSCSDKTGALTSYDSYAYVDRPKSTDIETTLTATLSYNGATDTKDFELIVRAEGTTTSQTVVAYGDLMRNIAASYTSSKTSDPWGVLEMERYGRTDAANDAYTTVLSTATEAKYAISALAQGNTADADTVTNRLKSTNNLSGNYYIYSIPYILLAYDAAGTDTSAGCTNTRDALVAAMVSYLSNLSTNGADTDEVTPILAALAKYYNAASYSAAGITEANYNGVRSAVASAINWLSNRQNSDGTWSYYGTSCSESTALSIVALSALGIDAHTDSHFIKNYNSAVEGLMTFALTNNSGFGHKGNVTYNAMATEQGFRALVAYANFKNGGKAYNIYTDATTAAPNSTVPAPNISVILAPDYVPPTGSITVSFTLVGDTVHGNGPHTAYITWIPATTVTVQSGSTVGTVFTSILSKNSYTYVGAAQGYVSSITTPGGVALSEKSNGKNSGWMYSVNGVDAAVGLNDYALSNGDTIRWFYEDDYTTRSGMGGDSQKPGTSADVKYVDVSEAAWYKDAVSYVAKKGLIAGTGADTFSPSATLSRAMLVTALWNLAGNPSATACAGFVDVADGAYYAEAVNWAKSAGVAAGYGSAFGANDPITRQQLAAMLFGYAKRMGYDTAKAASLAAFTDVGSITDWAKAAAEWANAEGLMTGRTTSTLAPLGTATRAETATVLMRFCTNLIK